MNSGLTRRGWHTKLIIAYLLILVYPILYDLICIHISTNPHYKKVVLAIVNSNVSPLIFLFIASISTCLFVHKVREWIHYLYFSHDILIWHFLLFNLLATNLDPWVVENKVAELSGWWCQIMYKDNNLLDQTIGNANMMLKIV